MASDRRFCCEQMETQLNSDCQAHPSRFDCPDALVDYSRVFDEYGLIIHDGGSSGIRIHYCPWCGTKLPETKRYRWFEELEKLGILNMDDERIPPQYKTDEWYRED